MYALVMLDRFAYSLGHIYKVQFWSDASDYLLYHSALLLLMVKLTLEGHSGGDFPAFETATS